MNQLLDNYLCKKYPKIFSERNLCGESCMAQGICIKEGWFFLLDRLCNNIQCHIDNPRWIDRNDGSGLARKPSQEEADKICPQVTFLQVKEKLSGLRIYYSGGDEYIRALVNFSESLSHSICEVCGVMDQNVGRNSDGWMRTTCENHFRNGDEKNLFLNNCDEELKTIFRKIEIEKLSENKDGYIHQD